MQKHIKAASALLAVFPTVQTFLEFSEHGENLKIVRSIINFAVNHTIIGTANEGMIIDFIESNEHRRHKRTSITNGLDFEELLKKKADLLNIRLSVRALTARINTLLCDCDIELPKVTNSMLTRLKKEPADTLHKRNVLRSLAFYLGYERPDFSPAWHYEILLKLCRDSKHTQTYRAGIRIGFGLYGRGDVIDHDIVDWLKRQIKDVIETSADFFIYSRWGKVKSHDLTTLYIDLPKENEFDDPSSYRHCVRTAVCLAHQISIRWALSTHFTPNRFLSIGLAVGNFCMLDNYVLPLLSARLPGDPIIRLTGFARQCLLANDIRTKLCKTPHEISLFNEETLPMWWIEGFWSNIYFDFIPDLLTDKILQPCNQEVNELSHMLCLNGEDEGPPVTADTGFNAVTTFLRSPHNALLGIEIVKTLFYRCRFWEALDVLGILLRIDPFHLHARTLRMMLYRSLALEAPSSTAASGMFALAAHESDVVLEHGPYFTEDFYCEYATNKIAQALSMLKFLRAQKNSISDFDRLDQTQNKIFGLLTEADAILQKAVTMTPSAIRSGYMLTALWVLKRLLKDDPELFTNPYKPLDGDPARIRETITMLQWLGGYRRKASQRTREYNFTQKKFISAFELHNVSISLPAYQPTVYFCHAVALWDFFPVRTVATVKRALYFLKKAIEAAKDMKKKQICIYSFTRIYGRMIPATEFIAQMQASIRMIETKIGNEQILQKDNDDIIDIDSNRACLLLTYNF